MKNLVEVETVLAEIAYPVDKKGLIRHAKQSGGSAETLQALKEIPDQQYNNLEEVQEQLMIMEGADTDTTDDTDESMDTEEE